MDIELQVNNSTSPRARFISWVPSPCRILVTNPSGSTGATVNVKISGKSAANGGAVVFGTKETGPFTANLSLAVPTNGGSAPFLVAGKFGRPSVNNGDVTIEVRNGTTLV